MTVLHICTNFNYQKFKLEERRKVHFETLSYLCSSIKIRKVSNYFMISFNVLNLIKFTTSQTTDKTMHFIDQNGNKSLFSSSP